MIQIERYSDLVSRLSYDCEGEYNNEENIGLPKDEMLKEIRETFDTKKVLYGGGVDSPNNIGNDLELVDYHYSNDTLYISVKINDNNPNTEDPIIIGCTGINDDLLKGEISDWTNNFLGIAAQNPSHGNIDYNTSFYDGVRGFISDQRKNGDIIGITGHSRGGYLAQVIGKSEGIPNINVYNSAPVDNKLGIAIGASLCGFGILLKNRASKVFISSGLISLYNSLKTNKAQEFLDSYVGNLNKITVQGDTLDFLTINDYKYYNGYNSIMGIKESDHVYQNYDLTEMANLNDFIGITAILKHYDIGELSGIDNLGVIDFGEDVGEVYTNIYKGDTSLMTMNLFNSNLEVLPNVEIDINTESMNNLSNNLDSIATNELGFIRNLIKSCIMKNNNIRDRVVTRKTDLLTSIMDEIKESFLINLVTNLKNDVVYAICDLTDDKNLASIQEKVVTLHKDLQNLQKEDSLNGIDVNVMHYSSTEVDINGEKYSLTGHRQGSFSMSNWNVNFNVNNTNDIMNNLLNRKNQYNLIIEGGQKVKELKIKIEDFDKFVNGNDNLSLQTQLKPCCDNVLNGEGLRSAFSDNIVQTLDNVLHNEEQNTQNCSQQIAGLSTQVKGVANTIEQFDKSNYTKYDTNLESNVSSDVIKQKLIENDILDDVENLETLHKKVIGEQSTIIGNEVKNKLETKLTSIKDILSRDYATVYIIDENLDKLIKNNGIFSLNKNQDLTIKITKTHHNEFYDDQVVELGYHFIPKIEGDTSSIINRANGGYKVRINPNDENDKSYINNSLQSFYHAVRSFIELIPSGKELSKSFSIIIERAIYEQENLDAVKHSHDYIYEYLTTLEKELKWVSNQLELYKADVIKELVNKIENILFDISVFKYIIESSFNIESKKV